MNYDITLLGTNGICSFPLHIHNEYELIHYTEGAASLRTTKGDIPVFPGNIVLIPPGVLHGTYSENAFKAFCIRSEFKNIFHLNKPILIRDDANHEAESLIHMIYRNRVFPGDYLNTLIDAYTHLLLKNAQPEDELTRAVQRIANEISEQFIDCYLSPVALLKESGYAEDYIRAHFKKIIGKTPVEFLTHLRVNHAIHLIETYKGTLSLSEVAECCGFTDYVYFSKKFKKEIGLSPKEFEKKFSAS